MSYQDVIIQWSIYNNILGYKMHPDVVWLTITLFQNNKMENWSWLFWRRKITIFHRSLIYSIFKKKMWEFLVRQCFFLNISGSRYSKLRQSSGATRHLFSCSLFILIASHLYFWPFGKHNAGHVAATPFFHEEWQGRVLSVFTFHEQLGSGCTCSFSLIHRVYFYSMFSLCDVCT